MGNAVLNGTLLDDGGLACEIRFQYGVTTALGTTTPWIAGAVSIASFSQLVTGLPGNTNYFFRAEARNAIGTSVGAIRTFITTRHSIDLVSVEALPATLITDHGATLNGVVVNDGGQAGAVRFEYGLSTDYGMVSPWQRGFASGDAFNASLLDLGEGMAYHFRAELQGSPSVKSRDLTFTTLSPLGSLTYIDDELLYMLQKVG